MIPVTTRAYLPDYTWQLILLAAVEMVADGSVSMAWLAEETRRHGEECRQRQRDIAGVSGKEDVMGVISKETAGPVFVSEGFEDGMWDLVARGAYSIRFMLKERGWDFRRVYGREKNVWVLEPLTPPMLSRECFWLWGQGWKINGLTMEEARRGIQ